MVERNREQLFSLTVPSVYDLCTGNVSGVRTTGISAFVMRRSAQEELRRSSALSKFYSRFPGKIHVLAKADDGFPLNKFFG